MSYKIKANMVEAATLKTVVEYTFADGEKKEIEIPHFMPDNKEAVIQGIENREISEQKVVNATKKNELIKQALDKEITSSLIEPLER